MGPNGSAQHQKTIGSPVPPMQEEIPLICIKYELQ